MNKINWEYCQEHSDEILSDGILKLKESEVYSHQQVSYSGHGNYLISLNEKLFYIGEAKAIRSRIKQQFKPATSTFYKSFLSLLQTNQAIKPISIDSFSLRILQTDIGRKEIEDFGIVNLSTPLNKFQKGKRRKFELQGYNNIWDVVQENAPKLLAQGEETVFKYDFISWYDYEVKSTAGLYIVKDRTKIIYIGESSDINERHQTHSNTTYFSALRRHIGTDILGYNLQERNGKRKYFSDVEDINVSKYLKDTKSIFVPVSFGRYELEEYLIRKHKPLLNRKDN